jgi:hypothetical protein
MPLEVPQKRKLNTLNKKNLQIDAHKKKGATFVIVD